MKKLLVFALVIGVLLAGAAFAEDEQGNGDVKVNLAARYYPYTLHFGQGTPDYNINAFFVEGNLFVGKDKKWKGSLEYHTGSDTKNGLKLDSNQFTGRIGYDVWEKLYLTLDYKSHRFKLPQINNASRTFNGMGFGLEKQFELAPQWPVEAAIHYYPSLDGKDGLKFKDFEYEVQVKYQIPNAVDIQVGYKGESWNGFDQAKNTDITMSGPYFGISKEF